MTRKTTPRWIRRLEALGACPEAVEYAKGFRTFRAAWEACERGDWMLWFAGRMAGPPGSDSRRPLVLAACECARLPLERFERAFPGYNNPRKAIETAEAWARGGDDAPTLDDVRDAAYAASAAASAAIAAASAAAYAASDAAYAASAAAFAAVFDAAYAASDAAYAAAAYAAAAAIVRKHYPKPPVLPKDGAA